MGAQGYALVGNVDVGPRVCFMGSGRDQIEGTRQRLRGGWGWGEIVGGFDG